MKKAWLVLCALVMILAASSAVLAQEPVLTVKLSRDWGYGGLNGDIQGTFSIKAGGPADLTRVVFYIDYDVLGEVTSAPFSLQFVTDAYEPGVHMLSATGYTASGQILTADAIEVNFVTAEEGNRAAVRIVVPLLAVAAGAILLMLLFSLITGRKLKSLPPGTPRQYPLGGGICPKCGRPSALQVFGLNMVVGKLQPCPYCGKWSIIRRAPLDRLRAAEQAELEAAAGPAPVSSEEDRLRKELDDSRYQGL